MNEFLWFCSVFFIILIIINILIFGKKPKTKVYHVNGRYCPMSGNSFVYRDDETQIIIRTKDPEKALILATEEEAQNLLDEYNKQPRIPRKLLPSKNSI